jgi:hypothetical protein
MSQFSLYSDVSVLSIRLYLQPRRTLMSLFGCIRFLASFRLSFLCIYSSHSPYVFRGMQLFTILCSIPRLRPHSTKSTILICVLRTAYGSDQYEFLEFHITGSYLLALLTPLRKRLDTDDSTKGMPRNQIILCAISTHPSMQPPHVASPRVLVNTHRT